VISQFIVAGFFSFFLFLIGVPLSLAFLRFLGLFTIVDERRCHVYVLFGNVVGIIAEPGLHFLPFRLGLAAFLVHWLGRRYVVDLRLDQEYLRSQPVNSEEGAPMGIGIWYEMFVSDPVAYLFKNMDPRGSLRANVSNTTVRSLSNMRLGHMLENRHAMSRTVRAEVTPKSNEWGYQLGSVYIRKVHFRDIGMIRQIEEKVVNRLRQVTSAIQQDGANQVSVIRSTAERQAAVEFARCRGFLVRELSALPRLEVCLALGALAWGSLLVALAGLGFRVPRPAPRFAHGAEVRLDGPRPLVLLASYHVSRQNTNTGRLTPGMLDEVLARVRDGVRRGR
jgi:regulator of protease activity HflC (stomatin/prohibitin superfamily)